MTEQLMIYLLSGLSVALLVALMIIVVLVTLIVKMKHQHFHLYADKIKQKKGIRYSQAKSVIIDGQAQVTHLPKDIILERGQTYTVAKKGKIIPGQYTLLAADESGDNFTVKIDDVVKTYAHNCSIVLAEGSTISPRSSSVILR